MENLECVLNDFYYCLNIPIQYLDKNWNVVLNKGYDENSILYFNKLNILEICKMINLSIKKLILMEFIF